jgi:hypothetical protein
MMTPAGMVGWPCILSSSKLSTEDDVTVFEGEYCSILSSGLMSLAMPLEIDRVEGWSVETLELRLLLVVLTTVTVTPLFT